MKILINLIGEQPIPNLLPALFIEPDKSFILYTDKTALVANRLFNVCKKYVYSKTYYRKKKIDAYNINSVIFSLKEILSEHSEDEIIFNITGGTKLMSIALLQVAIQNDSKAVYLQSENNKNILHTLKLNDKGNLVFDAIVLPELINIKLYLKAHLDNFIVAQNTEQIKFGIQYENAVVDVLRKSNFEILQSVKPTGEGNQIEIDIVIRLKGTNNVGIAEVKIGDYKMEKPKKGIDQLSTAGSREYLGIYTKKFLITRRKLNDSLKLLAKKHNIIVIDKISANNKNQIYNDAKNKLITILTKELS